MTVELGPDTDVGAIIRERREGAGLTQAELGRRAAEQLGRPRPFGSAAVAAWERGRRQPDRQTLAAIGNALGVVFVLATGAARAIREAREARELEAAREAARTEGGESAEGPKSERMP